MSDEVIFLRNKRMFQQLQTCNEENNVGVGESSAHPTK